MNVIDYIFDKIEINWENDTLAISNEFIELLEIEEVVLEDIYKNLYEVKLVINKVELENYLKENTILNNFKESNGIWSIDIFKSNEKIDDFELIWDDCSKEWTNGYESVEINEEKIIIIVKKTECY